MAVKKILNALLLGVLFLVVGVASASDNKQLLAEMKQRANEYEPCKDAKLPPEQRFECSVAVDNKHPLPAQQQQMRHEQRLDELRFWKVDKLVYECLVKLNLPKEKITRQIRDECYSAADNLIPKSERQEAQSDKHSRDATDRKRADILELVMKVLAVTALISPFIIGIWRAITRSRVALNEKLINDELKTDKLLPYWSIESISFGFNLIAFSIALGMYMGSVHKASEVELQMVAAIVIGAILVLVGFGRLTSSNKLRSFMRQSWDFISALPVKGGTITCSVRNLHISVDKENKQIIINQNSKLSPFEFSCSAFEITEQRVGNTGGSRSVYKGGEYVGSVDVPGTSYTYTVVVAYKIEISGKNGEVFAWKLSAGPYNKAIYLALKLILKKISEWCDPIVEEKARQSLTSLLATAGIGADAPWNMKWDREGKVTSAIVADRSGKAIVVYGDGTKQWIGSLKGASAQILSTANSSQLEIKVDDSEYREKHLTERRFTCLDGSSRDVLVEWEERINLLAKTAA